MKLPSTLKKVTKNLIKTPLTIILPLALFLFGYWFALPSEKSSSNDTATTKGEIWTCSMHPQIRQPNPGLCPICNMDLIPLASGGNEGGLRQLTISPEAAALLDIRVSPVLRAPANVTVNLFGKIDYDERSITTTTARISGRLDRLYADFTGTTVSKGDEIAKIYSPELYVAQQELIQARKSLAQAASPAVKKIRRNFLKAAREKLRLLEISDAQIAAIEKQDQPSDHITLTAPQDGIIVKLNAKEGDYLKTGDPLFSIAKLDSVWLKMEAYEQDLPWLRYAQDVAFTVEAIPEKTFHGVIAFIDPQLDPTRRIVKVRVNVPNKKFLLKPGMFANATVTAKVALHGKVLSANLAGKWISPMHPEIVKDGPGKCDICGMPLVPAEKLGFIASSKPSENPLLVPATAVLRTGKRAVVYLKLPSKKDPTFEGREITLGARAGKFFIVKHGLEENDLVVTKGAYKLDSELQIQAKPSMMNPNAGLVELPANSAPEQLLGQWKPVLRSYGQLINDIRNNNIDDAKATLKTILEHIKNINTDQLQPKELALWKEFSNRLINTIISIKHPDARALTLLEKQMQELGRYTGLPWNPIAPPKTDIAWVTPLKPVTATYLKITQSLSKDNAKAAIAAIPELLTAAQKLPESDSKTTLINAINQLNNAGTDIKAIRLQLTAVSHALIPIIRKHAINQLGDLYVVHCPMAPNTQGTKGADWLSPIPKVQNPYYGSQMFTCGSVTDTLSIQK